MKKRSWLETLRRGPGLLVAVPALIALFALSPVQPALGADDVLSIRDAQAAELKRVDAEFNAKAAKYRDPATGRVDPNTPEYKKLLQEHSAAQNRVQEKYGAQRRNLSSVDHVQSQYGNEIKSSGSNIKDARSDVDYTAASDEAAKQLADDWKKSVGPKNVEYDPHTGSYRNKVTDEVCWEPSTPQRNAARVYNADAYTTHTPGQTDGSNPYGQTLDHEKKFIDYGEKGDLRGQSKAASKMYEDLGLPPSETIKRADAMRNYQGEYQAGVKTLGDAPELQAQDTKKFQENLNREVETAKDIGKTKTEATIQEQVSKANQAREAGDLQTAKQIEKNIHETRVKNMDVQDANMRAAESKVGANKGAAAGEAGAAGEPAAGEAGGAKVGTGAKVLDALNKAAGVVMVGTIGDDVKKAALSDKPGEELTKVGVHTAKGFTGIGTIEHVAGSASEKGDAEDAIVRANEAYFEKYRTDNIIALTKAGVPPGEIGQIMDKFDKGDSRFLDFKYDQLQHLGVDVKKPELMNAGGIDQIAPDNTVGERVYDNTVVPAVKAAKFFGAIPGDLKDAAVGFGEKKAAEGEASRSEADLWDQTQQRMNDAHLTMDQQRAVWEKFNNGDHKGAQGLVNDAYKDLVPLNVNGQTIYLPKDVINKDPFGNLKNPDKVDSLRDSESATSTKQGPGAAGTAGADTVERVPGQAYVDRMKEKSEKETRQKEHTKNITKKERNNASKAMNDLKKLENLLQGLATDSAVQSQGQAFEGAQAGADAARTMGIGTIAGAGLMGGLAMGVGAGLDGFFGTLGTGVGVKTSKSLGLIPKPKPPPPAAPPADTAAPPPPVSGGAPEKPREPDQPPPPGENPPAVAGPPPGVPPPETPAAPPPPPPAAPTGQPGTPCHGQRHPGPDYVCVREIICYETAQTTARDCAEWQKVSPSPGGGGPAGPVAPAADCGAYRSQAEQLTSIYTSGGMPTSDYQSQMRVLREQYKSCQ